MMIAMSPIAFDGILHKMNGITSSYELCDVLILVISRFAEMMGKMAELQANDGGADGSAHVAGKRYTTMEETQAERIHRQALAEEQERVRGLIGGSDMLGMRAKMGEGVRGAEGSPPRRCGGGGSPPPPRNPPQTEGQLRALQKRQAALAAMVVHNPEMQCLFTWSINASVTTNSWVARAPPALPSNGELPLLCASSHSSRLNFITRSV
jgi:hypothetical protein